MSSKVEPVELSVGVPVYNEEPNLDYLFEQLEAVLARLNTTYKIVCVNDGSRGVGLNFKSGIFLLTVFCIIATGFGIYLLGGIDQEQLQIWLIQAGIWAPITYIALYTIGTILILPSTPLNLSGGAIFGLWWGTLWTSIAAVFAAVVAFAFTRTVGREFIARKLAGHWETIDAEMRQGGLFYIFAIRLLPIIPYGLVNFAAGLTSIRFRDYFIGTVLGTLPGILPFVLMGSGLQALGSGDVLPLMFALVLIGMLVGGATWYRRRRQAHKKVLQELECIRQRERMKAESDDQFD